MDYKVWGWSLSRARLVPVLTLGVCALVLLSMAALDRFHAHQYGEVVALKRDFEQTRQDLLAGFQRLSQDRRSADPSDLARERQLLLQKLQRLQTQAQEMTQGEAVLTRAVDERVADLWGRLTAREAFDDRQAARGTPLQASFLALTVEMARLESALSGRMDDLQRRQQLRHLAGWLLALLAVTLIGWGIARNNRDLRAAQQALREREAYSQRLLDMLPQLVWICDDQARIDYFNQRWVDYTGLSMQELLDKGWAAVIHPDDLGPIATGWAEVVSQGATTLPEFRLRRRDGRYRWFTAYFGASHRKPGEPARWFGSSVDVDDMRNARTALEQSERFHRELLTALNEGVMTFAPGGRVTICNPAAARLLGLPHETLLGESASTWPLSPKDEQGRDIPWDATPTATVFATGQACRDVLVQISDPAGNPRWLLVSAEPMRGVDGETKAVVSSFRDVTERRRVQMDLRAHQERLELMVADRTRELSTEIQARREAEHFSRLVADSVPGRIAYWDRDVRCLFVNKTYCDWFGEEPWQIVGRTMRESRGEAYHESVRAHIEAVLRGEAQDFEREEYLKGDEFRVSRVQYRPDWRNNEVVGFFVLAIDITQQKQVNAQLAAARDRAASNSEAKSAFLANMSHEIRTPMNAIIGFAHMLRRELRDPQQRQHLARISEASDHLLQVINDILDLAKIETGKLTFESVEFSLETLLQRTCSMVAEQARAKGLELVVSVEPVPDLLRGDPTRLMQALLNLLSNAVKFTERGSVSLRVAPLAHEGESVLIRFEVIDTGIGIAEEDFTRLFNPFVQAEGGNTRQHGGTGLGLTITRHIAEHMGGQASGESQPGQGSRFWFTARLRTVARQGGAAPAPVLRGLRALLADDLDEARAALKAMLIRFGLRVDDVSDGAQALEAATRAQVEGDPYPLVLLDWTMPVLDGLQAGTRLAALPSPPQALVLVSTRDDASVHQLARDAGFAEVLLKPVAPSQLLDCLMRVLRGSVMPQPMELALPQEEELRMPPDLQGRRVLLAEDNPVNQELATLLLRGAGLVVDVAGDGEQALRQVRGSAYDLVLMDVQMPRMDGLQATRLLRQDPAYAGLPIIAMTANALQEDRRVCLEAGMNDHLSKPVDPHALHQMLLRWLRDPKAGQATPPTPRAAPSAHEVRERLTHLSHLLDLEQAYAYCNGQDGILLGVMRKFTAHYREAGAALVSELAAGQREAVARRLHSLRGVCAAMGARDLLAQTQALEQALGAADAQPDLAPLVPLAETLRTALDVLVSALDEQLGEARP